GISGGVVGLIVVVVLLMWLFGGGGGALTAWVPGDGEHFQSVRLADLWKSPTVQAALKKNQEMRGRGSNVEEQLENEVGLKPSEIDRLTTVRYSGTERWTVVEAVSSYDEAKMRDKLTDGKELSHENKKYYKCKSGTLYVHFASSSLFVMGPEAGVKKALSTSANRTSGALDEGLAMLSSSRQVVRASRPNNA